jgi:hypothetical protein
MVEDEQKPLNSPSNLNRNPEISSVLPPEVVQGAHSVFKMSCEEVPPFGTGRHILSSSSI